MINSNSGMVKISGHTVVVLADLACIVQAIAEGGLKGIETKEELKEAVLKAVEDGFKNAEDESHGEDIEDALASLLRRIAESLEKGKGEE